MVQNFVEMPPVPSEEIFNGCIFVGSTCRSVHENRENLHPSNIFCYTVPWLSKELFCCLYSETLSLTDIVCSWHFVKSICGLVMPSQESCFLNLSLWHSAISLASINACMTLYYFIGLFRIDTADTAQPKKALNSHQTLFLVRGWD